jgi:hypothetical protein
MNKKIIRKTKWFWPWQDAQEEAWLEEMSRRGLHLKRADLFAQYEFIPGQPQEYTYRLDFQDSLKPKSKDEYLRLFTDDGWQHVGQMSGWQYFRKPIETGGEREIFTDNASKIQKYNRFAAWFGLAYPSYLVVFVALWGSYPEWFMWLNVGIIMVLSAFWAFIALKVAQRIKELKVL